MGSTADLTYGGGSSECDENAGPILGTRAFSACHPSLSSRLLDAVNLGSAWVQCVAGGRMATVLVRRTNGMQVSCSGCASPALNRSVGSVLVNIFREEGLALLSCSERLKIHTFFQCGFLSGFGPGTGGRKAPCAKAPTDVSPASRFSLQLSQLGSRPPGRSLM